MKRQRRTDPIPVWRGSIKRIEGTFGSGLGSFFTFLRWLFLVNLLIATVYITLVILPMAIRFDYDLITETFNWFNVIDGAGAVGQTWIFYGVSCPTTSTCSCLLACLPACVSYFPALTPCLCNISGLLRDQRVPYGAGISAGSPRPHHPLLLHHRTQCRKDQRCKCPRYHCMLLLLLPSHRREEKGTDVSQVLVKCCTQRGVSLPLCVCVMNMQDNKMPFGRIVLASWDFSLNERAVSCRNVFVCVCVFVCLCVCVCLRMELAFHSLTHTHTHTHSLSLPLDLSLPVCHVQGVKNLQSGATNTLKDAIAEHEALQNIHELKEATLKEKLHVYGEVPAAVQTRVGIGSDAKRWLWKWRSCL